MKNILSTMIVCAFGIVFLTSCKRDTAEVPKPARPNEAELITTMKLVFNERNTSNVLQAQFRDTDGDGGKAPVIDTIRLEPGKTYRVAILLLDETKNPVDTISHEVSEEGDEHQFFYDASGNANITFDYADKDDNDVPVGLLSDWTTGAATADKNGKVKVILKHQGDAKPKTGDGDHTLGDTDIEVNFPVIIK